MTRTPLDPVRARALPLLLLLTGCATPLPEGADGSAAVAGSEALVTSLEVQVREDSVRFILHATNSGELPAVLEFASGQRYDFLVRDDAGDEIWRWSAERMFTQALGQETIPAGETVRYEASWPVAGRRGTFTAVGRITARDPIERETSFALPADD